MKSWVTLLALLVALGLESCGHPKKKFVLPAAPKPVAAPLPEAKIETPPEIQAEIPLVELPNELHVEPPPAPAPKKPQQATHPTPVQPAPPETQPPAPTAVTPPAPAPKLGEILTEDRRKEYENEFASYVSGAQSAVKRASGRRLNTVQKEMLQRIGVFLQQAQDAKANDLPTARELARRAYQFGEDLVKSLR